MAPTAAGKRFQDFRLGPLGVIGSKFAILSARSLFFPGEGEASSFLNILAR